MGRISIVSAGVFSFRITCGDQRHFIINRAGLRVWHWKDGKRADSPETGKVTSRGSLGSVILILVILSLRMAARTWLPESNEMFIAIIHSMFFIPLGTITARNIMLYKAYRRLTDGKVSIQ